MAMFFEIKVRVNGEEKWVDGKKVFDYLIKEYSKVNYEGKVVEPYPDRVNKFYDNIPNSLIEMWGKAYPNVDIKRKAGMLGRACQNGGQIPVVMSERKLERQIAKQKKYEQEAMTESASHEEWTSFVKNLKKNIGKK